MATLFDLKINGTDLTLPTGTTAQRPSPLNGMIRYNTSLNVVEYVTNGVWVALDSNPRGTGGTIVNTDDSTIHAFTSNGTFSLTHSGIVEYLIVAGGGGGADTGAPGSTEQGGGGGGAGGVIYGTTFLNNGDYPITIGAGGRPTRSISANQGENGGNSTFNGLTALGGGGGGCQNNNGADGGSGGGGGGIDGVTVGGEADTVGGATLNGQGSQGGGVQSGGGDCAGGGGGAGQAGGNKWLYSSPARDPYTTDSSGGQDGGPGLYFPQFVDFGDEGWFAGGGGGGSNYEYAGRGGRGGGGDAVQNGNGGSAQANTGGGGAGGGSTAGTGGSGIVLIRYLR